MVYDLEVKEREGRKRVVCWPVWRKRGRQGQKTGV
jgi:hypothetical protein